MPDLTRLPPGVATHQPPGEALRNGYPVSQAPVTTRHARGVAIMTRQVSQAEYAACVAAAACKPLDAAHRQGASPDLPATGISWSDASAYAAWLSGSTGQRYRLPRYAEWVYAAGEAYREETLSDPQNGGQDAVDPAQRWLVEYEQQSRRGGEGADTSVRPFGGYGVNAAGLQDMAGSVWEWTSDCHSRRVLDAPADAALSRNCGIRVAAGRHIAYLPDFIRDPKSGACSVGVPPANLGLRLVLEEG
ncbi:SUMF1/EgtB/PvdO family nonheme iron enzyme [Achromobacter sp. MFA1 R4]|uniref:SUMF1/EgtB/PvdO family nonheme iron enzyme n=1 Tax=Achromobacter sp. MFA1 R4 TaxID=1881016 RepID=UPI001E4886EF|nr:SUMF1/EgtB/PvdO family nonheme iron enzyme [Achromobacter sp. MFA1 R4]